MVRRYVKIRARDLCLVLGIPGYLFSDLGNVRVAQLIDGRVMVDDPNVAVLNGTYLVWDCERGCEGG